VYTLFEAVVWMIGKKVHAENVNLCCRKLPVCVHVRDWTEGVEQAGARKSGLTNINACQFETL
jgi:hypothetical protein